LQNRKKADRSEGRLDLAFAERIVADKWKRRGRLRLLRGPDDLENYAAEVPPVDGTLLIFPNGPTTWHGHKTYTGQRYVVQMNYMTTSTKAKAEMRRHHLSAFIKRLTRAA